MRIIEDWSVHKLFQLVTKEYSYQILKYVHHSEEQFSFCRKFSFTKKSQAYNGVMKYSTSNCNGHEQKHRNCITHNIKLEFHKSLPTFSMWFHQLIKRLKIFSSLGFSLKPFMPTMVYVKYCTYAVPHFHCFRILIL